ncbi:sugar porter family MFS transporter [Swaminathania salitolerans]|uniref:MFS transporter n=1 Tax=Swaminathania salitolerans TaxID=182838 RepID=A0A511BL17_9PROT|nr:sugar porter family MFS transporter [Swaminathania salitolerans]GBQ09253.1 sugar-proton symporter [Swaminathania salitolerans LMG 21291]GEL01041.1 MFS transporter [Swaminathania salitolerans]
MVTHPPSSRENKDRPDIPVSRATGIPIIYIVGPIAALAGLLFGMDIGVISGALDLIARAFALSSARQEAVVSAMMLGAIGGAVIGGWLSHHFGRRKTLLVSGFIFALGALVSALAPNADTLIGARIVLGIAVGISSYIAPIYLSEIAPEKQRGSLISCYQFAIMAGILVAYLSDAWLGYYQNWRLMLGIIALPAIIMVAAMIFLPTSPRWLMTKGRDHEALAVLLKLRQNDVEAATAERDSIRESLRIKQMGPALFARNPDFRRSTYLGMMLQFMQQFTGANVILYYAPKILGLAGLSSATDQMWGTVAIGALMTLATLIAIGVVDRLGRKPLLYTGFFVMCLCMIGMGVILNAGVGSPGLAMAAIAVLIVFVISYAMSAAPMVWILCSEIQPLNGRDFGVTCSTATNWIANFVVGATFLTLLQAAGPGPTFFLYAALNALFIILTFLFVPETKGMSLEKIERNLMAGKALRHIGV